MVDHSFNGIFRWEAMAVECCVRYKSERGSASNPVVQMSSSSAGRIFPQSLVPRLSLPPSNPQQ